MPSPPSPAPASLAVTNDFEIFISYAREDSLLAGGLRNELQARGETLPGRDLRVFIDTRDVTLGDEWAARIEKAQRSSWITLVIVSDFAKASRYVIEEVERAVQMHRRAPDRHRLVPVFRAPEISQGQALGVDLFQGAIVDSREALETCVGHLVALLRRMQRRGAFALVAFGTDDLTAQQINQLNRLTDEREAKRKDGRPTIDLERQIATLKRALRGGHALHAGDRLGDGRYRLLNEVGRGAAATVWRAEDTSSGALVALRVLHPSLSRDEGMRRRFIRGAQLMHELEIPGVVRVLDARLDEEGVVGSVHEFVDGVDLAHLAARASLTALATLEAIRRVGATLQLLHEQEIVHRDVKPSNIVFRNDQEPLLTDFDLVTAPGTTHGTMQTMLGTYGFAAPEMLQEPDRADHRADIYSLAATATYALHHGNCSIGTLARDPHSLIQQLDISATAKQALKRAMTADPEGRQATVTDFVEDLFRDPLPESTGGRGSATTQYEERHGKRYRDQNFLERMLSGWADIISGTIYDDDSYDD